MFLITGVQGSGKTYYGVKLLKELLSKPKFINSKIYTNIDNFQLSHFLIKDLFLELETAYKHYLKYRDGVDENNNKINRYLDLTSIVLMDEAHNYLNKSNDLLVWFVTEHRHLNIELIVLTQKETLIHHSLRIYDRIIEALPPSSTFSSSYLRYNEYSGLISSATKIRSFNEKKDKSIFAIYKSGDILETKRPFFKWILIAFALIIVVVLFFLRFLDSFYSSNDDVNQVGIKLDKNISKVSINGDLDTKINLLDDYVLITILFDKKSGKYQYDSFIFDSYIYKKFDFHVIDEACYDNICASSVFVTSSFVNIFQSNKLKGGGDVNKTI